MPDTVKTRLEELADRCEAATGPSHELDLAVADACYTHGFGGVNYDPSLWVERYGGHTASLDAAMTLVPEGCFPLLDWTGPHCRMRDQLSRDIDGHGFAATPALALTAAALRARAAKEAS